MTSLATVELVLPSRPRSIGTHTVGRVLPAPKRRAIGSFVFLDHMGPVVSKPGERFDVLPHPHIGLSTVTYLFEGESVHRDSLGVVQEIRPGDVNWMTAGRGIVHSERSTERSVAQGGSLHGLQLWAALPQSAEEGEPTFQHHPSATLPKQDGDGVSLTVIAGEAHGLSSPVRTHASLFYLTASLTDGAELALPASYPERGAYLVEGRVAVDGVVYEPHNLLVFTPGDAVIRAVGPALVALLGGAPLDGPRHMWWNFVSSSKERIEVAKRDWQQRRFPVIPTDDVEFVPLPEF